MQIKVKSGFLVNEKTDVILLEHFEDSKLSSVEGKKVNALLGGLLQKSFSKKEFTGKLFQHILFHTKEGNPAAKVLLVGLGKKEDWTLERTRKVMGKISALLRNLGIQRFSSNLLGYSKGKIDSAAVSQAMVEGTILGLYQFNVYRTEKKKEGKDLQEITLLVDHHIKEVRKGVQKGKIIAEATNFVRDLGNHPSNVVNPSYLAKTAKSIAKTHGLKIQVLNQKQMEKLGMGSILGVSKGSTEPPCFIILEYGLPKKNQGPIVLVGKSVTFDTGGISLKPSDKMDLMKGDMSGGAAVLGTLQAIAQLKPPLHIVGLLPVVENMPSGAAIKPGDILISLSGKTIEVLNTDAEGRLCLADALTYATRYKPQAIIDLATLTGAVVVALGTHAIGAMSQTPPLLEKIKSAGERSGERIWELPLWEEYEDQIKGGIADLKNIGGRGAGTITAGLFLKNFVDGYPWVHLDIAGTAWTDGNQFYSPKGSTGVGVRLLVEFLTGMSENKE